MAMNISNSWAFWLLVAVLIAAVALSILGDITSSRRLQSTPVAAATSPAVVFSPLHETSVVANKQRKEIVGEAVEAVVLDLEQQRSFVQDKCGTDDKTLFRFNEFVLQSQEHLATELWKYCALSSNDDDTALVYWDLSNPMLISLRDLLALESSVAILDRGSYLPRSIHGSMLILQKSQREIARTMLQLLVETPVHTLTGNAVLLPRTLYALLAKSTTNELELGRNNQDWYLLEQSCHAMQPHIGEKRKSWSDDASLRQSHLCPTPSGYCCNVRDEKSVVMMNRHPLLPLNLQQRSTTASSFVQESSWSGDDEQRDESFIVTRLPYWLQQDRSVQKRHVVNLTAALYNPQRDLVYISTVDHEVLANNRRRPTRRRPMINLFDSLLRNDCAPSEACNECLRGGASHHNHHEEEHDSTHHKALACQDCMEDCSYYCRTLCDWNAPNPTLPLSKRLLITPPAYSSDPNRLIPRIVHQRWYEDVNSNRDSNDEEDWKSRLLESFRNSGWEYRFYTDDQVVDFLKLHYPPVVAEAYEDLVEDRARSDFFRYCVLLIYGGLYANVNVLLESNLDMVIEPQVGFMAVGDQEIPGCLSHGILAAAPGHPVLAKALELSVNRIRNRYSQVDLDAAYCPQPDLALLRSEQSRHVAGACVLGTSFNQVLNGNNTLSEIRPGTIQNKKGAIIPGSTLILRQTKDDMGGNRFTDTNRNLLVAVADVKPTPKEKDDESDGDDETGGGDEEEETVVDVSASDTNGDEDEEESRFDFDGFFVNRVRANEEIQIEVVAATAGSPYR